MFFVVIYICGAHTTHHTPDTFPRFNRQMSILIKLANAKHSSFCANMIARVCFLFISFRRCFSYLFILHLLNIFRSTGMRDYAFMVYWANAVVLRLAITISEPQCLGRTQLHCIASLLFILFVCLFAPASNGFLRRLLQCHRSLIVQFTSKSQIHSLAITRRRRRG